MVDVIIAHSVFPSIVHCTCRSPGESDFFIIPAFPTAVLANFPQVQIALLPPVIRSCQPQLFCASFTSTTQVVASQQKGAVQ